MPSELLASVTIHNEEEFNTLIQYWESQGYYNMIKKYSGGMHSLQAWKCDHSICWGSNDGADYNDGIDWISDFAGDFNEYASLVGINAAHVEIDVEEYL